MVVYLPIEKMGKVSTAIVTKDLLRSFKAVRFGLMVGVSGGVVYYNIEYDNSVMDIDCKNDNSEEDDLEDIQDIWFGDVVISLYSKSLEAVV